MLASLRGGHGMNDHQVHLQRVYLEGNVVTLDIMIYVVESGHDV